MCSKKRFTSRALAVQKLHFIKTQGEKREKNPVRVYQCKECGGYHLTSISLRGKFKASNTKNKQAEFNKLIDYWTSLYD